MLIGMRAPEMRYERLGDGRHGLPTNRCWFLDRCRRSRFGQQENLLGRSYRRGAADVSFLAFDRGSFRVFTINARTLGFFVGTSE